MNKMMWPAIIILAELSLAVSAGTFLNPEFLPIQYHHEIFYPESGIQLSAAAGSSPYFRAPALFGAAGIDYQPPRPSVNLFTPNTVQQPAETSGQVENYRKYLEEEAREADKAENQITTEFAGITSDESQGYGAYVSVVVNGDKGYNYGYSI